MTDPTKLVDGPEMAILAAEEAAPLIKQLEVHAGLLKLAMAQNDKQLVSRVLHHLPRFGASLDASTLTSFSAKYCSDGIT